MKSKVIPLLIAGIVGTTSCDYDPAAEPVQRDMYTRLEDCMADWGDKSLCLEAAKLQEQKQEQHSYAGGGGGGGGHPVIVQPYYFYGPEYIPGSRYTYYGGRQVAPLRDSSVRSTPPLKPTSNFVSGRQTAVGSAARGGFGSAGRSATGTSVGG